MTDRIELDTEANLVSSLSQTRSAAERVRRTLAAQHWKQLIIEIHSLVQSAMASALEPARPDHVADQHFLLSFGELYEKIKADPDTFGFYAKPRHDKAMDYLRVNRNRLIHFTPGTWSARQSRLVDASLACLELVAHLVRKRKLPHLTRLRLETSRVQIQATRKQLYDIRRKLQPVHESIEMGHFEIRLSGLAGTPPEREFPRPWRAPSERVMRRALVEVYARVATDLAAWRETLGSGTDGRAAVFEVREEDAAFAVTRQDGQPGAGATSCAVRVARVGDTIEIERFEPVPEGQERPPSILSSLSVAVRGKESGRAFRLEVDGRGISVKKLSQRILSELGE